jgi:hypothetical protein
VAITKLHVKTYESNLRHLAQQRYSKLLGWVQSKSKTTSSDHFPRMAARSLETKAAGRVHTPETASEFSNRVAIPATYHTADQIQPENAAQILVDPKAAILEANAAAVARKIDNLIISAAFSNAIQDEAGNTNTFPAAQEMTPAALTFAYVAKVLKMFLENEIEADEPKVFIISPNGLEQLQAEPEATSSDFVNMKALAGTGVLSHWMGFDWIVHPNLSALHDTNQRDCIAMTRRALGYLSVKEPWVRVAEDPSHSFDTVIYTALTAGATRIEDEQIVKATIIES